MDVHGKYDEIDCDPHPYTSANKGPIFDLIIELIEAIIEWLEEPDTTYLRIDFTSGNMTVYLSPPISAPEKISQEQHDNILEASIEILDEFGFSPSTPYKNFEIIWNES